MNQRQIFLRHVAQTSPSPLGLEIVSAKNCQLIDASGKKYLDLIAGISVCNVGHRHPKVIKAIRKQLDRYLHVLVYGELIETPQVEYAQMLTKHLPNSLNSVYFTNSGSEATEGAMKLAKKVTGRTQIIAFEKSYHGSTQGSLSVMGDEYWRNAFRPLLPDVLHVEYDSASSIEAISDRTACVIVEPVQAERGVYLPSLPWMKSLEKKCRRHGALLIVDEIQTAFGKTGSLWCFEHYKIRPDILLLGKALGGGMPLGAFIANRKLMRSLMRDPVLGHITTFGGHPVCCAAGMAAFKALINDNLVSEVDHKENLFRELLVHPEIEAVRSMGLLIAIELKSESFARQVIDRCVRQGLITDFFLFAPNCLRIAPPLTISEKQIKKACRKILACLD